VLVEGVSGGARSVTDVSEAGVIVVGATDVDGAAVAPYSSRGPVKGRLGPHVVAPGGTEAVRVRTCVVGGGFAPTDRPGTSYAAPHASGLVALLLEQNRGLTPDQLRDLLVSKAEPIAGEPEAAQGAGLVRR